MSITSSPAVVRAVAVARRRWPPVACAWSNCSCHSSEAPLPVEMLCAAEKNCAAVSRLRHNRCGLPSEASVEGAIRPVLAQDVHSYAQLAAAVASARCGAGPEVEARRAATATGTKACGAVGLGDHMEDHAHATAKRYRSRSRRRTFKAIFFVNHRQQQEITDNNDKEVS